MLSFVARRAFGAGAGRASVQRLVSLHRTKSSTRFPSSAMNSHLISKRTFTTTTSFASPAAKQTTTTKKKATTKKPATKKTTKSTVKKKKPATKKKTVKAAPKKKKVTKPKPPVKRTPRNTPALKAPPRGANAYALFYQKMFPTLNPKPATITEAAQKVSVMWKALSELEKEAFTKEAKAINAQRALEYNKWRASLSRSDVVAINAYRTSGKVKHPKLGSPPEDAKRTPTSGYVMFYKDLVAKGEISVKDAPGETFAEKFKWTSGEVARRWRALSDAEKASYKP